MSGALVESAISRRRWILPAVVFSVVLAAQLWLVAAAGNDVPFYDQWGVEGSWLYPAWRTGQLGLLDLFRLHNEHRIFWTHLLNLGLFALNGQWDPLVQIVVGAGVHALVAATITLFLTKSVSSGRAYLMAGAVAVVCLPIAGWHNALWGFQSQVYFSILFGVPALAWLPRAETRWRGAACALAAMLAMGSGGLLPVALLVLLGLRRVESRSRCVEWKTELVILLILLFLGLAGQTKGSHSTALQSASISDFFGAWLRLLAWPHPEQPMAALIVNLPLALVVGGRLIGRRRESPGENLAVALGMWALIIAAAAAWTRGGGEELANGIPSRYVDFLVLLLLANGWCLVQLATESNQRVRLAAFVWTFFVSIGWLGFSAEMWQRVIHPLANRRDQPAQLMRSFQQTRDPAVFNGQPRLLVPHPTLGSMEVVLDDPRMTGALPPSLQPEKPMGPLSRGVRWLLRR